MTKYPYAEIHYYKEENIITVNDDEAESSNCYFSPGSCYSNNSMVAKTEGEDAFAMYRNLLWIIGVWPLEKENTFQTCRFFVSAFAQAAFMVHTGSEIYMNNGQISAMVDVFLFFSSAILTLLKNVYLYVHRHTIRENLENYIQDWTETNGGIYLKIMRDHVKIYKYQFIIYNACGYIGTTGFVLRTILVNILAKRRVDPEEFQYELVCQTSFLSQDFVKNYYPVILALQYVQLLYCCTSGAMTDCFFFGLIHHQCAQLEILKLEWRKLGTKELNSLGQTVDYGEKVKVTELIDKHKKLVILGENLEASFSSIVLVQLMISIILICSSGCSVLVSVMEQDYVTMLISTNCISFMITESFIYGYGSDYLMRQSESIVDAVYSCKWYELEKRIKKDILFVMMKAQTPLYITAGKFFYVTRNTTIQLLKTSASYLSVLRLTLEK